MNILADIVIGALVVALIAFALYKTIQTRKKGGCSCCNGSNGCCKKLDNHSDRKNAV